MQIPQTKTQAPAVVVHQQVFYCKFDANVIIVDVAVVFVVFVVNIAIDLLLCIDGYCL